MITNPYQSPQAASLPECQASWGRFSFLEIFIVGHIASFFLLLLAPAFAMSSVLDEFSGGRYLLGSAAVLFTRLPWLVVVLSLWGGAATASGVFIAWRVKRLLAHFLSK